MKHSNNWKGGRVKRTGYWYIKIWDHPNSGKQGYVAEHRLVMEKHLGRYLKKGEVVHHINEDREDNRIENLELIVSPGIHSFKYHKSSKFIANQIKKGQRLSKSTEFKKGQSTWNKGLKISYKPRPKMKGRIIRDKLGRITGISPLDLK